VFDAKPSHWRASLETPSTTELEYAMLWKLLGLQKKLDALFDDGWVGLGFATASGGASTGAALDNTGASLEQSHA